MLIIGVLLLTFGSGIGVGLFMGGGSSTGDAGAKASGGSSSGQDIIQGNTLLSSRIRELESEISEQKNQNETETGHVAFFKGYQHLVRLMPFEGETLKVTPEMAGILGLTKEEQKAVEQHLAECKNEMDRLVDADTVLTKQTSTALDLEIPIDPNGNAIKDKLDSALAVDIGEERAEFLMGSYYSGTDIENDDLFSGFATTRREIEITWKQQNGAPVYAFRCNYYRPDGSQIVGWGSSSIPQQFQKFISTNSAQ
jgi:hypothetical protein